MKAYILIVLTCAGIIPLKAQQVKPDTIFWVVNIKDSSKCWPVTNLSTINLELRCVYDTAAIDTQFYYLSGEAVSFNDSGFVLNMHSENLNTTYSNGVYSSVDYRYPSSYYTFMDGEAVKKYPKSIHTDKIQSLSYFYQNKSQSRCQGFSMGFMTASLITAIAAPIISLDYKKFRFNKPLLAGTLLTSCCFMLTGAITGVFTGRQKIFYFNDPYTQSEREWYILKHSKTR